jgi:hypothetical protein
MRKDPGLAVGVFRCLGGVDKFHNATLRGWTKNRHFGVGSSRNIPDIALPRLLELAVFASSRGAVEFVHAA